MQQQFLTTQKCLLAVMREQLDVLNEIRCVALETRDVLVETKVRAGFLRRADVPCSCIQPYLVGWSKNSFIVMLKWQYMVCMQ